jgi:membrane-associated protease RseP (regulator of RpoE activity)
MSGTVAIVLFVVSVIAAILIHELGHLLTAKLFGMRADKYFVGFGPTLWSTRRGETEYGLKLLPLGGFVRILGMSPGDDRLPPVVDEAVPLAVDDGHVPGHGTSGSTAGPAAVPSDWQARLADAMRRRGAGGEVVERVRARAAEALPDSAGIERVRIAVRDAIRAEVPGRGKVGELRGRLLDGDRGRFYEDQAPWRRAVVIAAGPLTHLLIAVVLLTGLYAVEPQLTGQIDPVVSMVLDDSPAEAAGLQAGDRLVAVDGVRSADYEPLRDAIRASPGEPVDLVVVRDGDEVTLTATPERDQDLVDGSTIGVVGFAPEPVTEQLGPLEAVGEAIAGDPVPEFGRPGGVIPMIGLTVEAMGEIFSPEGIGRLTGQAFGDADRSAQGAVSLVGAASLAGQAAEGASGLFVLLILLASINVFLALFNLVPLPPLDGGHLAVVGVEKVVNTVRSARGRSTDFVVDPNWVGAIAMPVIVFLLLFGVTILWLDIANPLQL